MDLLAHLHDRRHRSYGLLANQPKTTYMAYVYALKGEELDKNIYIPLGCLTPTWSPDMFIPRRELRLLATPWWWNW